MQIRMVGEEEFSAGRRDRVQRSFADKRFDSRYRWTLNQQIAALRRAP
jgi:hypothetical protein